MQLADVAIIPTSRRLEHVERVHAALCLGRKLIVLSDNMTLDDHHGVDGVSGQEQAAHLSTGEWSVWPSANLPTVHLASITDFAFLHNPFIGEIRVKLAHGRALRTCLRGGYRVCLIGEDDLTVVGEGLLERWGDARRGLPPTKNGEPQWDFVYLGRCWDKSCDKATQVRGDLYQVPPTRAGWGEVPKCLHAYLVTRAGAQRVLDSWAACPAALPADWAQSAVAKYGRMYAVSPALFTQSAYYRLRGDSSTLVAREDVSSTSANMWRPALVPECYTDAPVHSSRRFSLSTPTVPVQQSIRRAELTLSLAFSGAVSANRSGSGNGGSACAHLEQRSGAARSFLFANLAWQPTLAVIDPLMHACAMEQVLSLPQCDCSDPTPMQLQHGHAHVQHVVAVAYPLGYSSGGPGAATDPARAAMLVRRAQCVSRLIADEPEADDLAVTYESVSWPKPAKCDFVDSVRMNPARRLQRQTLYKLRNPRAQLEFRPVLKAGSTFLKNLLPCLQPGQWEQVQASTFVPRNFSVFAVVREPIERYVSAVMEVLRRPLTGMCPDGPCNKDGDLFVLSDVHAQLRQTSTWFEEALDLQRMTAAPPEMDARKAWLGKVSKMLYTMLDTSLCNVQHYASEHFMTQMALLQQGQLWNNASSFTLLTLETIGHSAEDLLSSPLLRLIGAAHLPQAHVAQCLKQATPKHSSKHIGGGFPMEEEMLELIKGESGLQLLLCSMYAQDYAWLSYAAPQACADLLHTSRIQKSIRNSSARETHGFFQSPPRGEGGAISGLAHPPPPTPPTWWSSHDGALFVDGEPLLLKGVNWYGFQTDQGVVHGLYAQPPSVFYKILEDNSFNAVRIPVDLDLILYDRKHGFIKPEPDEVEERAAETNACLAFAPGPAAEDDTLQAAALNASSCGGPSPLMQNTSLQVLEIMVDEFAKRGILVLLDLHCLSTKGTNASPVFFDSSHTVAQALQGWGKLARSFGAKKNVLGADVFNEPFGATWATGQPTDMDVFAASVAEAVSTDAPNWLIFVEGTAHTSCKSVIDGDEVECAYGDNLLGPMSNSSALDAVAARGKLVWSQHTYGPSQHGRRPEFHNANFPANMRDVWGDHWGALLESPGPDTSAVVLGEWGGPVSGDNGKWMNALVDYLIEKNSTSNFFWALNQDGNPEGIILDWTVNPPKLDAAKLALLERLVPHPTNLTHLVADQ